MAQRVSRERLQKVAGGTGQTVRPPAPSGPVKLKMGETVFEVTPEQKKHFDALPASLRRNLKTPKDGKVMGQEEFQKVLDAHKVASTVMCPW